MAVFDMNVIREQASNSISIYSLLHEMNIESLLANMDPNATAPFEIIPSEQGSATRNLTDESLVAPVTATALSLPMEHHRRSVSSVISPLVSAANSSSSLSLALAHQRRLSGTLPGTPVGTRMTRSHSSSITSLNRVKVSPKSPPLQPNGSGSNNTSAPTSPVHGPIKPALVNSNVPTPTNSGAGKYKKRLSFSPLIGPDLNNPAMIEIPPPFSLGSSFKLGSSLEDRNNETSSSPTERMAIKGSGSSSRRKRSSQQSDSNMDFLLRKQSTSLPNYERNSPKLWNFSADGSSPSNGGFFSLLSDQRVPSTSFNDWEDDEDEMQFNRSSSKETTSRDKKGKKKQQPPAELPRRSKPKHQDFEMEVSSSSSSLASSGSDRQNQDDSDEEEEELIFKLEDDSNVSNRPSIHPSKSNSKSKSSSGRRFSDPFNNGILSSGAPSSLPLVMENRASKSLAVTAESCFQKIDKKLRKTLKKNFTENGKDNNVVTLEKIKWIEFQILKLYFRVLSPLIESSKLVLEALEDRLAWNHIVELVRSSKDDFPGTKSSSSGNKKRNSAPPLLITDGTVLIKRESIWNGAVESETFMDPEMAKGGTTDYQDDEEGDQFARERTCKCWLGEKDTALLSIYQKEDSANRSNQSGKKKHQKGGGKDSLSFLQGSPDKYVCIFAMGDSFSRVLIHSLAQFYPYCRSESKDVNGKRMTFVQLQRDKTNIRLRNIPMEPLHKYLGQLSL